nr:PREDICTED: neuropeptide B [Bos mutus]
MVWTIVPRGKEPSQNLEVICSLPRNPTARALVLVSVLGRHVARVFGKCEQEEGQLMAQGHSTHFCNGSPVASPHLSCEPSCLSCELFEDQISGSEPRAGFSLRDAEAGASRRPPSRPAPPRRRYKARVLPFRTPPPAATESPVAGPAMLVAAALALCLLLASPGLAWYKPTAGQGYYSVGRAAGLLSRFHRAPAALFGYSSVGRAAGLLSGFHRSPYARRSEPRGGTRSLGGVGTFREMRPNLRSLAVCVEEVTPNLQSCEPLPDGRATFQCKADVFLSLSASDCRK